MKRYLSTIIFIILIIFIINSCANQQSPSRPSPPDEIKPTATPDMKKWTEVEFENQQVIPQNGAIINFNNKICILGGNFNNKNYNKNFYIYNGEYGWITSSAGGDFTERIMHSANYFKNDLYIIGGIFENKLREDMLVLKNNLTWTAISDIGILPRSNHCSIVHDNKLWIIGGKNGKDYLNDVWMSEDGKNFKKMEDKEKKFCPRSGLGLVSFQDKIWIIAGESKDGLKNDVWNSNNGIDWEIVTESAKFLPRAYHSSVVYKNRIWVIGGKTENGPANDIWWTMDGANWVSITANTIFPVRYSHYCIEKDGLLWIIGGFNEKGSLNDCWYGF